MLGAKSNFWLFCLYYDYEFFIKRMFLYDVAEAFQKLIDDYQNGKSITVGVSMPPRAGKSYITSLFAAYWLGTFPELSVMRNSCTATLYNKFSYDTRNIIKSERFQDVFNARLQPDKQNVDGWNLTQSKQVGYFGSGVGGTIIGFGANLAITDDLYKSMADALSVTTNNSVKMWKETAHDSRKEKNCPEIYIGTRWQLDDVIGEALQNGYFDIYISIPALINDKSFCEDVKTTDEYLQIRERSNPETWMAEYMQNPKTLEGLMFTLESTHFYEQQKDYEYICCFVDPADMGKDRTASIIYGVKDKQVYVEDVIYTADPTEITIPLIVDQIQKFKPSYVHVETNAAWRLYALELRRRIEETTSTAEVRIYNPTTNKEIRIYNEAPTIRRLFHFKNNQYESALQDMFSYIKLIKDQKDDFVDTLAAASKYFKENNFIDF
jgi:predicted phage terminase large subunit-like protein